LLCDSTEGENWPIKFDKWKKDLEKKWSTDICCHLKVWYTFTLIRKNKKMLEDWCFPLKKEKSVFDK